MSCQIPPAPVGSPTPAAGDGQGGAGAQKNKISAKLSALLREERQLRLDTESLNNIAFHLRALLDSAQKDADRARLKWQKANDRLKQHLERCNDKGSSK